MEKEIGKFFKFFKRNNFGLNGIILIFECLKNSNLKIY